MNVVLVSFAGVLGVLFLWGLVSPRSQWYALVGWTRSDPRETEPGSGAYGVSRFVSLIGLLALLAIGAGAIAGTIRFDDGRTRPPSVVEDVWGQPRSYVVDRVFTPAGSPPEGLVEQRIDGYQVVDPDSADPRYLFDAGKIRDAGQALEPGFLGVPPVAGIVALETADVVVHVRGDDRCIPQSVMAVPVDGGVQVGAFFGQPRPPDGSNDANVSNCDPGPPRSRTRGYLIPVDLTEPLGDRVLQSVDGVEIPLIPLPE